MQKDKEKLLEERNTKLQYQIRLERNWRTYSFSFILLFFFLPYLLESWGDISQTVRLSFLVLKIIVFIAINWYVWSNYYSLKKWYRNEMKRINGKV